jgi:hypothetical protein
MCRAFRCMDGRGKRGKFDGRAVYGKKERAKGEGGKACGQEGGGGA